MQEGLKYPSIHFLSPRLANQIAAGEVIERPASVVKELLENALDANAKRIDIELQSGGMEAIRVTDDGEGIYQDELPLAISRHATSKITELDDLLNIASLGFRGEALASICSVSKWEITSRQADAEIASQISSATETAILEANHAKGTTVSVRKLFHNTPARRKFLRAERTEFRHCDDVIRRMALARFDVGFYVKHNGRQVHRLPAVTDDIGQTRRVAQLCGESFINNALVIDFPRRDMRLWGWISKPSFSRQQTDLQYFYINGRVIRDRVVNHAIRIAYQNLLPPGRQAAYVLHLEIDPAIVDINVHPTKHEVRFRETRMVHDFITHTLRESLSQSANFPLSGTDNYAMQEYLNAHNSVVREETYQSQGTTYGAVSENRIIVLHGRYAILKYIDNVFLLDMQVIQAKITTRKWEKDFAQNTVRQKPLLIPEIISLSIPQLKSYEDKHQILEKLGFDITQQGPSEIMLRCVPVCLQGYNASDLLQKFLDTGMHKDMFGTLRYLLSNLNIDLAKFDLNMFMQELLSDKIEYEDYLRSISATDLSSLLRNNE